MVIWTVFHRFGQYSEESRQYHHLLEKMIYFNGCDTFVKLNVSKI
ncbi:hypothetical protein GPDM_07695 [Planococcus donghaensis MPA1U2]|uniref:Uncharacterized protein n=1 Tax=Planococcus donghaensis MPA1U2 TaxID=933115 RepID=E7RGE1_9BACL|nr:hypothetical protein GPDM_07695 [Planococcus donghaensis MPA1U2]